MFDLIGILEESGALMHGHFLLASGKHSERYVEKFHLLRRPDILEKVCAEVVRRLGNKQIDVVAGPTTGGILIAAEIARQMQVRAAYAERLQEGSSQREFRRVNYFEPGDQVLVVDDVMTSGSSILAPIGALKEVPVTVDVADIFVLVDRSNGNVDLGRSYQSLVEMNIPTWSPDECPLCEAGKPLLKPGTTQQNASIRREAALF